MGGVVEMYGDKTLPLLIEWDSTPEWGPILQVELVIGAIRSTAPAFGATFAPVANGPRSASTPGRNARSRLPGGGRNIERADGYSEMDDPTSMLRFFPLSLSGHRKIHIPLAPLSIGDNGDDKGIIPDRLYIRAFARSQPMVGTTGQCAPDKKGGQCVLRYAFSNPIWSISPSFAAGRARRTSPSRSTATRTACPTAAIRARTRSRRGARVSAAAAASARTKLRYKATITASRSLDARRGGRRRRTLLLAWVVLLSQCFGSAWTGKGQQAQRREHYRIVSPISVRLPFRNAAVAPVRHRAPCHPLHGLAKRQHFISSAQPYRSSRKARPCLSPI